MATYSTSGQSGLMPAPPSSAAESRRPALALLLQLHARQTWRRLRDLRRQSKLLSSLIALFVLGYAVLAFVLFGAGLRFVGSFPGLGYLLVERLMFLLFAFLFILLLFSNLVISYTNLFRNRETTFLLTLPIDPRSIFQWKLIESVLLASWAFLFLVSPLLMAYGLHARVPWHFYLVTPILLGLFILLPGALGAWGAVYLARFLDRRSFQLCSILVLVAGLIAATVWLKSQPVAEEFFEARILVVLDQLLAKTRFAENIFFPSYWLSAGVLQWAEGAVVGASFFVLLLLSYALFLGWIAAFHTGHLFVHSVSAVQSRGSVFWQWGWFQRRESRRTGRALSPPLLDRLLNSVRFLSPAMRGIMVKDIRVFWRDTTQWGQTLVLFGLLGAYILNLRHFSHQLSNPFWVHLVSYLNLGACSLNLATLTTRFVFPQFSLEGKRIWIVGLAPVGLERVITAKFLLACSCSLFITEGLMLISCAMLSMPWSHTLIFLAAVGVMTVTLNGLAVGLGALYPNFKEDHPGKIVSGFGGTFCLVLSFVYIVLSVLLLAAGTPWPWIPGARVHMVRVAGCWVAFLLLSWATGRLPFTLGLQRTRTLEI